MVPSRYFRTLLHSVPLGNVQLETLSANSSQLHEKLAKVNGEPQTVAKIFEDTITACTSFNIRGNGRPLLVNKKTTARVASTGTPYTSSSDSWDPKSSWPVPDDIVEKPLIEVFTALDPDKSIDGINQAQATQLLTALAEYVLEKHASSSVPDDDDDDDSESEPENERSAVEPEEYEDEEDDDAEDDDERAQYEDDED